MPKIGAPIRNLSRAEAKARGLKRYSAVVPCPHGHLSDRLVSNYTCIRCLHEKRLVARKAKRTDALSARHTALRAKSSLPVNRQEALRVGANLFYTGRACIRGHVASRHTSGAGCTECLKQEYQAWIASADSSDLDAERARKAKQARAARSRDVDSARRKVRQAYRASIQVKLRCVLRHRIKQCLRGKTRYSSVLAYLGCTIAELKQYLEQLFRPGMTWANHSHRGWHIDHKIPLARFDMTDEQQRKKAFHYSNLQPLWARSNQIKGKRLLTAEQLAKLI